MSQNDDKGPKSLFPMKTFSFNIDSSMETKKEIKGQLSAVNDRIDKIIDHFQIDNMPIVQAILNVTHDKDVLKGLSRALDRVADLIEIQDNLSSKLKIIEHAETDPSWFASTFGDFSDSIDKDILTMFGENNV